MISRFSLLLLAGLLISLILLALKNCQDYSHIHFDHFLEPIENVPPPVTTAEFLSSPDSQNFFSDFECNKYTEINGPYPSHSLYSVCSLTNVCLRRDGKWVLFLDKEMGPTTEWTSLVNNKLWLYNQPRWYTTRGDMYIQIHDVGPVTLSKSNSSTFRLSEDFEFIDGPSYLTYRYAVGNVGHLMMDGMTEAMITFLMWHFAHHTSINIVFLEDLKDANYHPANWVAAFHYNEDISDKYSIDFFQLLTHQPILQKCSTPRGWKISKAPCRNQNIQLTPQEGEELQTCFKTALSGQTRPPLLSIIGAEVIYEPFRTLISQVHGIDFRGDLKSKQEIVIAIHDKPKEGRHGEIIWNTEELLDVISQRLPQEKFITEMIKRPVRVVDLHLEQMSALEQVRLFAEIDVYIVDQGSAAYYTMFLARNAIVIQSPHCNYYNESGVKHCYDRFSQYTYTFPHAKVYPFLRLLPGEYPQIDCNARVTLELTNCDPILPAEITYSTVVRTLKERYKDFLYSIETQ